MDHWQPTWHVCMGVCVCKSHSRSVVSPEPLARCLPLGEKLTDRMASEWPGSEAVHRATGRTRNTACGWNTIFRAVSTETCKRCCSAWSPPCLTTPSLVVHLVFVQVGAHRLAELLVVHIKGVWQLLSLLEEAVEQDLQLRRCGVRR